MRILALLLTLGQAWAQAPAALSARPARDWTPLSFTTERLPGWLKLSGEFRTRVEGRTGFDYEPGNDDAYTIVRNRLNVELAPSPWLNFYFQGQDSRVPGLDAGRPLATFKDPFDIRQAYVRLGRGLVRVTVGRQLLSYGAQRLIGPLDWTNTSRTWDAVKVEIGTADTKVDLFASSVVAVDPARPNHHRDGSNIHGAYGSLKGIVPRATFEPYLLWKTGNASIWTGGFRVAAMPGTPELRGFDYQAEIARQWGTVGAHDHLALAGYVIVGYSFRNRVWTPRVSAEFSHASGDSTPGSGTHRTFDQLLPTNHLFYGITDPVGWRNMNMARAGLDLKPHKGLHLNADYRELWLASAQDALYNVAGVAAVKPRAGNTARHIGSEIDLMFSWLMSSHWRFGGGIGHLVAGRFLKENTKGAGQTFPYLFAQYSY